MGLVSRPKKAVSCIFMASKGRALHQIDRARLIFTWLILFPRLPYCLRAWDRLPLLAPVATFDIAIESLSIAFKVMLHETIRNDTVLQHCCDIVSNSCNIVPKLQHCVALKFVVANRPVYPLRQTANVNLYHVTKFSTLLSFTVHYNYTKICRFMLILYITIVLSSLIFICSLLILKISQLESHVCCLP